MQFSGDAIVDPPPSGDPPSVNGQEMVGPSADILEPPHELPPVNTLPPTLSSVALSESGSTINGFPETASDSLPDSFEIQDEELDALVKEMLDAEFSIHTVNY